MRQLVLWKDVLTRVRSEQEEEEKQAVASTLEQNNSVFIIKLIDNQHNGQTKIEIEIVREKETKVNKKNNNLSLKQQQSA